MQRIRKFLDFNRSSNRCESKRRKRETQTQAAYESLESRQLLATIVWSTADIGGTSDVSTNGNLVFAINGSDVSGPTTTVNGVDFVASIRANAASESQAQSPGNESLTTSTGNDNGGSFTNAGINGAMGTLLEGGWWGANSSGNFATIELSGLSIGDEYELQIFSSDGRTNRHDGYVTRLDNGAGGAGVDLQLNNQPNGNRPGDFGIGTFTADSSTQTVQLSGFIDGNGNSGRIHVNAIQLRKLDEVVLMPGAHPLINEFSASNKSVLDDDNGNSSDWIEIFNAGEDAVDLAGYSLTDDPMNTAKYVFPSTTLEGGDYLVVFAGDDLEPATGTDLYTGFGLSSAGEYIGFYDPVGALVTEFSAGGTNYPTQYQDVSYGFEADDTYSVPSYFATPTPGSANVNPVDGVIEEVPLISVERGFYDVAFDVGIVSQTLGATIVYTTDGTQPSLTNGTQVTPANANALVQFTLPISETTSLRTAAVKQDFFTRSTTTHSYVFLDDVITSSVMDTAITQDPQYASLMRDSLLDIPTLSFNYENVIVNSDVPEQRASIEWLAPDGSPGFQIDAGIKGFGGYFTNFAKKNFRVSFRSQYGAGRLDFPLFEGFDNGIAATETFDSLDFRSGSHDMSQRGFYMSNRFTDDTLMDAGHVSPHGRFVHIYTNGVYWGQYHMRERWDADFLAQYYGGNEDDFEAVNGNVNNGNSTPDGWSPGDVYDGEGTAWSNVKLLADTDGSGDPTGGYQELKEAVNLEQYIDYMLVYMAGSSENEYRAGGSSNGVVPYVFTLNDADGWLRGTGDRTNNAGPGNILGTLVAEADPEFLTLYADRIHHMFGENGVLSETRAVERLQERLDEIQLSFISESARWGYRTPDSWSNAADNALQNMLPNVADEMIDNFRARGLFPNFHAPNYLVDGVPQNGGEVVPDSLLTFTGGGLVYYTVDGSDPRTVGGGINPDALIYNPGSSELTLFGSGATWKYEDSGSDLGTAWRNNSYNDNSWSSGVSELGYGDGDEATVVSFGSDSGDKHITTYFRKTFDVAGAAYDAAELRIKRDDGAVVYLNGTEIVRSNMPTGTIDFETEASGAIGGANEDAWNVYSFDPALLLNGSNTLAVEIHQAAPTSSDITFDAELVVVTQTSISDAYVLSSSTNVKSRTIVGGEWSALHDATFVIPAAQSEIRISEIHYNPADPTVAEIAAGYVDNDDFEFIELYNPNPVGSINLTGMQLSNGVTFNFSDVDLLPGERAVVVEDFDAFLFRYGSEINVLGEWNGGLSNSGEQIDLVDDTFAEIMSVNYGDNDPWHKPSDGHGFSLVLDQPHGTSVAKLGKYYSWRTSTELGGTPGGESTAPQGVVVNEVLAHTDAPDSDSIELFNPTSASIDLSGWFLSDAGDTLLKFEIPAGTVLAAGGYVLFDEDDFNPNPTNPGPNDFALSGALGDQVYLSRASGGTFLGLEDAVEFDATFNGESLGRLPNGTGRLTRLAETSFGSANGDHAISTLLISEVNYHPEDPTAAALAIDPTLTDNDLEFIEISNPTNAAIDLTNWRIRGESDYDFAAGSSIAAGGTIVILAFDPADPLNANRLAAWMEHYGLSSSDNLVGGLMGSLSNSSGRIALQQPDVPDELEIPRVVVDEVVYDDLAPWGDADGSGSSLNRIGPNEYANDPDSWEGLTPTPGSSILVQPSVASVLIGDGSTQRSTIDQLVISFDGQVDLAADAFSIIQRSDGDGNATGASVDHSFATSIVNGNTVVTITFLSMTRNAHGALVDGNYQLIVDGSKVTRSGTSTTLGENYVLGDVASDNFFSLYGDNNGSRNNNIFDLLGFRQSYLLSAGDADFNAQLDYDGNGTINIFDLLSFRQNYRKTLAFV